MNNKFSKTLIAVLVSQTALFGCFEGSDKPKTDPVPKQSGQLDYKRATEFDKEIDKQLDLITKSIAASASNTNSLISVLELGIDATTLSHLDKESVKEQLEAKLILVKQMPVYKELIELLSSHNALSLVHHHIGPAQQDDFKTKNMIKPVQLYINKLLKDEGHKRGEKLSDDAAKRKFLDKHFPALAQMLELTADTATIPLTSNVFSTNDAYQTVKDQADKYLQLVKGVEALNSDIQKVTGNVKLLSGYNESNPDSPYKASLTHQRERLDQLIEVQKIVQEVVGDQSQLKSQVEKALLELEKISKVAAVEKTLPTQGAQGTPAESAHVLDDFKNEVPLKANKIFAYEKACQLAQGMQGMQGVDEALEKLKEQLEDLKNAS